MKKTKLPSGVTEDQIKEWKGKYGEDKISLIRLPKNDERTEFHDCIARTPDRLILGEYLKFSDRNPNKANEILVKNCLLSGKDEVLADDALFMTAVTELAELIPIRKGEMVKL